MSHPVLKTSRLLLSPLSVKDMDDLHLMLSSPEIARFNTIGVSKSIETTRKHFISYFQENEEIEANKVSWCIRAIQDDTFIGEIGINLAPERYKMAELHYSIMPGFWGSGYATESAIQIIDYCFNILKLHRVEAGCAIENKASIRVLEKIGMTKEGRKRKVLPLSTGWSDNYSFSILEEDVR